MIKSFLIIVSLQIILYSSEQIILVVSDDFNSSKAFLECYDDGKKVFDTKVVNIGAKGLGWGLGEVNLKKLPSEPLKKEGDKKAPAGIFKLTTIYGYAKQRDTKLPYLHTADLICVDNIDSEFYNQIIPMPKIKPKSFEIMNREDHQYELGIVVEHNQKGVKKSGSCIFIHVKKSQNASTAGCTAMSLEELEEIVFWLDKRKNPILIQIPKSSASEILKLYPELKKSKLLN